ncbi:MAG: Mth938-like domain-containing protein [Pseudomonadota bacterium]
MRLNEIEYSDADPIDGYGPGFFRIGGQIWTGHVITGPKGTRAWDGYTDLDSILELADSIDVLFVGTGNEVAHLPAELRATLDAAGLGVEGMTSPAAARTYNVLLSEGRRVAVALLSV